MQDLELYRLTPLFWFDDSLSNRKNLIIELNLSDVEGISSKKAPCPDVQLKPAFLTYLRPRSPVRNAGLGDLEQDFRDAGLIPLIQQ